MTFQLHSSKAKPHYTSNGTIDYYSASPDYRRGIDVLGLVVFCITFGAILSTLGPKANIMIEFFDVLMEVSIRIIRLIMWFSPLGISSLICVAVLEMQDPIKTFTSISYYMLTVLIGLAIQGFILLPLLYMVLTRKNALRFAKNMSEALLVALATASSAATLPVTFRCIEEKNRYQNHFL
jgi:Na+/H+-dicarboxylate symporter